jgi:hypothetical protein
MKLRLNGTDYIHTPYGIIEKFFVGISRDLVQQQLHKMQGFCGIAVSH